VGSKTVLEHVLAPSWRSVSRVQKHRRPHGPAFSESSVKVGDDLFAIGTPLGQDLAFTLTRGVVSGLRELGGLSLVQTADRAKGDKPEVITYSAEPGVYLLEVRDSKNRESNFQDQYQLTVEEAN